jgi:hypothetical protein
MLQIFERKIHLYAIEKKRIIEWRFEYEKIQTGKFEIILKVKAVMIPQIRNIRFNWEYFFPHVGLLRINSALTKSKRRLLKIKYSFTFDDDEYKL